MHFTRSIRVRSYQREKSHGTQLGWNKRSLLVGVCSSFFLDISFSKLVHQLTINCSLLLENPFSKCLSLEIKQLLDLLLDHTVVKKIQPGLGPAARQLRSSSTILRYGLSSCKYVYSVTDKSVLIMINLEQPCLYSRWEGLEKHRNFGNKTSFFSGVFSKPFSVFFSKYWKKKESWNMLFYINKYSNISMTQYSNYIT